MTPYAASSKTDRFSVCCLKTDHILLFAIDSGEHVCYHRPEQIFGGDSAVKLKWPRTKDNRSEEKRPWWMGILTVAMLAATCWMGLHQMSEPAEAASPLPARMRRSVLYVMDQSNLNLTDVMAAQVDQVNYSFALIEDGKATGRHWQGIRQMSAFLRRHPDIDGVLSVGGWGADGFSDAAATEAGRKKLADSILALMDEHGFRGVDLDWEYPGSSAAGIKSRPEDVENWYKLLAVLREGLDERQARSGQKYILSVALGAGESQLSKIDGARLGRLVDQAVVMAYDLKGFDRITGHHAGLYPGGKQKDSGAYAVKRLIDSGLSKKKILLGIPAYGRVWRQVSGGGDGMGQRAATAGNRTMDYPDIQALESKGYTRHYDEKAQAAWWFDGSTFVSGEDEVSLAAKTAWLREQGLLGVAVWEWRHADGGDILAILSNGL